MLNKSILIALFMIVVGGSNPGSAQSFYEQRYRGWLLFEDIERKEMQERKEEALEEKRKESKK